MPEQNSNNPDSPSFTDDAEKSPAFGQSDKDDTAVPGASQVPVENRQV